MALKWIAADIDGTILDSSSRLPPENVTAFRQARDRGVEVVLVTGRRYGAAVRVANGLGLSSPLIVNNGAMIVCPVQSRRLARWFLAPEVATAILSATSSYTHCTVLHKDRPAAGQLVVCSRPRTNGQLHHYLNKVPGVTVQVESLRSEVDGDLIEIMFSGPLGVMEAVEGRLRESGFEKHVRIAKTYYREKDLGIIDVLNRDCSKRSALDFLARSRGIRPEEIMAIGDNHSDLEMLEYAGVGVVMANGVAVLKNRGLYETASNDDLGVARAVGRFILQSQG
ncbi:MAG: HAD hydrolase family protein [Acidobacteria bacterium]|nr:HAD hydrolase family protein [Acidobacteriota bacterium]